MHCTKISAKFEFGGHSPLGANPQNVAFSYDVGKIVACGLVLYCSAVLGKLLFVILFANIAVLYYAQYQHVVSIQSRDHLYENVLSNCQVVQIS